MQNNDTSAAEVALIELKRRALTLDRDVRRLHQEESSLRKDIRQKSAELAEAKKLLDGYQTIIEGLGGKAPSSIRTSSIEDDGTEYPLSSN